ncbi:MAG: V-type ATP synthase subunit E [Anaerosomatales bacterium]|nr:V-type ATP synthase subunit E [Anaerosomatales bacterium]MDT8434365.1 V-type ATP synthase subunit E [Anaerosomatales bacterium]
MALEDIFRALDEQADKECEDILATARAQAEAILADAEEQAAGICSACVEHTESAMQRKAAKQTNAARLEGKKKVASVKEAAVSDAFEKSAERLASIRTRDTYPAMFKSLVSEALAGVSGDMVLLVDPSDEALARQALDELGVDAEVRTELTTSGGVAVLTGNGRIMRRNTLEDRLDKVRNSIQSDVAEILFS